MQQRVRQGLEDGARLPCLDIEKLRGENNSLREEQQRLKKVRARFLSQSSSWYLPAAELLSETFLLVKQDNQVFGPQAKP